MANMTPTNLLAGFAKVTDRLQKPEFRMPNTAAVSMAAIGDALDTPMSQLRTREDRQTYFDWMVEKADEGATGRAALHTGGRMDSQRSEITWGAVVDTFSISMKQNDNNSFTFEETFSNGILNSIRKNLLKFDNAFLSLLKADVTQVNAANLGTRGSFNDTDFIFELANTEREYWPQIIEAVFADNNHNDELILLADSIAFIDMMRSLNQGSGNEKNLWWQFGNSKIIKTNKSLYSGYNGSVIAAPANMVALFPWIPKQNRKPIDMEKAMSSEIGDFGQIEVPIFDGLGNQVNSIPAAISIYSKRADTSSYNGNAQDVKTEVEVSWDYAYMSAPLSNANESVVYAFGANSGGATT